MFAKQTTVRRPSRSFEKNYEAIDLVVLDMIMPQMSGGELFDALKGIDPDCNVLLSSGYNIDGEARKIMDRGCRGFIQKPFGIENLSNQIRTIIGGN